MGIDNINLNDSDLTDLRIKKNFDALFTAVKVLFSVNLNWFYIFLYLKIYNNILLLIVITIREIQLLLII